MSDCSFTPPKSLTKPTGCGPANNPKVDRLIPNLWFKQDCNCHDDGYTLGGVKHLDPTAKERVDGEFRLGLWETANRQNWFVRPFARLCAKLYALAVEKGGEKSFNWFDTVGEWLENAKSMGFTVDTLIQSCPAYAIDIYLEQDLQNARESGWENVR